MIGESPRQMEVSFAPKSVENLSRPRAETPSIWPEKHEFDRRDCPVLHLLWIKRRRTSELTVPLFQGIQNLDVASTRTKNRGLNEPTSIKRAAALGDRPRCAETNI